MSLPISKKQIFCSRSLNPPRKYHGITRLRRSSSDLRLRKAQIQKSAHLQRRSVRFHEQGRLSSEMPFSTDDHEPPNRITAKLANLVWSMTPDCREVTRLPRKGATVHSPLARGSGLAFTAASANGALAMRSNSNSCMKRITSSPSTSIRLADQLSTAMPPRGLSALYR